MIEANPWHAYMLAKAEEARRASHALATLSTPTKDAALEAMAQALVDRKVDLLEANAVDLAGAEEKGLTKAMIESGEAFARLKVARDAPSGIVPLKLVSTPK